MDQGKAEEQDNELVLSYNAVRIAVGVTALTLPIMLLLISSYTNTPFFPTMSDCYHGPARDYFVGALCAIAVFMASYKGYDRKPDESVWLTDRKISMAIAICAVLVAFVPTVSEAGGVNDTFLAQLFVRAFGANATYVHYAAAVLLLGFFAVMCLVNFRRSSTAPEDMDRAKRFKNRLFLVCGVIVVVGMTVGFAANYLLDETFVARLRLIFWVEVVAVWAFSIAWLVKGEPAKMLR